ncbi:MAG: hypothetical protein ABR950_06215 [Candidatus Dormibacteria bacterium]|jgi:hypothetical protein
MRIDMPCYGISVELGPPDPNHPGAYQGGALLSELSDDPELEGEEKGALIGVERMILACACAGIDVASPAFVEAVETVVEAIGNEYG